jgi:hypothetical protein
MFSVWSLDPIRAMRASSSHEADDVFKARAGDVDGRCEDGQLMLPL